MIGRPALLIAALSGRALAEAARRAGYAPLVADLFGDTDCRAAAAAHRCVAGCLDSGRLDAGAVIAAFWAMLEQTGAAAAGVVVGAGFESQPDALGRIAAHWPLLGSDAAAVARAKSPEHLAACCAALGIATPRVARRAAPGFLRKREGGAGGSHVGSAGSYWQARVAGESISALLIGLRRAPALLVGCSAQWTAPAPATPYRFGGAVQPVAPGSGMAEHLPGLVGALGLVGLVSVDMIATAERWGVIEVNPRPGATLDIFDSAAAPLLARHVAACRGARVAGGHAAPPAAIGILYADGDCDVSALPAWCADRPAVAQHILAGAPVCTVRAAHRAELDSRLADAATRLIPRRRSLAS